MILKYSEDYDSIINLDADIEYINDMFSTNEQNLYSAKIQLFDFYVKEYESNLTTSVSGSERSLAGLLNDRNFLLIESRYLFFRLKEVENSNYCIQSSLIQNAFNKGDIINLLNQYILQIKEISLALLSLAGSFKTTTIWGKERNIKAYLSEFKNL